VIGVHYTWPTPDGMQQAQGRRLETYIDRYPKDRLIVAGDLNSTPWSFTRRDEDRRFGLERRTRALFSWPAQEFSRRRLRVPFPFLPIDHVYAGSGWRTVKVERGPVLGSDHYPVIVTLAPAAAS
jgi:endonuclease/exonuclease/phosphatase (EEP) superfamily protein YafD